VLPYLKLQLVYLVLSGLIGGGLWAVSGRLLGREGLRRRFLLTAVVFTLLTFTGILTVRALDHWRGTSQFILIAFLYYFAGLWLPVLAAFGMWRRKRLDGLLAGASAVLFLGAAYALLIEPDRLQLDETRIEVAAWPAGVEPLRIVHISDLQTVGACRRERRAARMIADADPDLIIWCGDYVSGPFGDPEPAIAAARAFLGSLSARYGVVLVPGHSEPEWIRQRVIEGFDVHYLTNDELRIELDDGRRLRIFGATAEYPRLELMEPDDDPQLVTIVATHVPDLSTMLNGRGVDLHLAGHTHGGQISFPFIGPPVTLSRLPNRYARGLHHFGDHWLHVTPGIGMEGHHAPRIRFLCPPEVDVLLLGGGGTRLAFQPLPERTRRPWEFWRLRSRTRRLADRGDESASRDARRER